MSLAEPVQFPTSPNPALSPTPLFGSTFLYFKRLFPVRRARALIRGELSWPRGSIGPTENVLLWAATTTGSQQGPHRPRLRRARRPDQPAFPPYVPPTRAPSTTPDVSEQRVDGAAAVDPVGATAPACRRARRHVHIHAEDAVAQTISSPSVEAGSARRRRLRSSSRAFPLRGLQPELPRRPRSSTPARHRSPRRRSRPKAASSSCCPPASPAPGVLLHHASQTS